MIELSAAAGDTMRDGPGETREAVKDSLGPVFIAVAAVVLLWGAMIGRRFGWGRAPLRKG